MVRLQREHEAQAKRGKGAFNPTMVRLQLMSL